ncbi:hypothetical protein [Streptomyces sp. DH18]|uniref:hypothetical protein n=1 Tax=Streptomyces sp. DH18 TaxID=3040126 RepID=UPI00244261AF|nr:hypothetical protein [Streptomyces sp. DH18]
MVTPYPGPSRPYGSRVRCLLATLVLTVLTLVGGAGPATAAASAPTARSLAPAVLAAAQAPAAPQTDSAGHHAGRDSRHRAGHSTGHDFRHRAGHATGPERGGPDRASGVGADPGTGAVAQAGHEQPRAAADPAQAPRAGTGRAYLLLHAPPPPHDALTPAPPGPAEPRGGLQHVAANSFDAPGSRRGALPGVRGPPGRTTGPTTGHPSCSADPAPRPH